MALILIVLGLFFVGVDIWIPTAACYPAYVYTSDIGRNIQKYIVNHIVTDHVRVDLFPDILGCILLLIGVTMLVRHSRKFQAGYVFIILTAVLSLGMKLLPFYLKGKYMVVTILIVYTILLASEIIMEFLVLNGAVEISDALPNQSTNRRAQFGWWITVFCRIFIFFLTFCGLITIVRCYQVVLVGATLFYLWQLVHSRKYIGSTHKEKKTWQEKVLEKSEKKYQ